MSVRIALAGAAVLAAIVVAGIGLAVYLAPADDDTGNYLPGGEYVALQHIVQTTVSAAGYDDQYLYLLAVNLSVLDGSEQLPYYPQINDSLAAIYLDGVLYGEAGCHGGNVRTVGAYGVPFTRGNASLRKVTADGTALIIYKGQSITLSPGQSWISVNLTRVNVTMDGRDVPVEVNESDMLENFGVVRQ